MPRIDPTQTVTVYFPDGPRDVPCEIHLNNDRPLYTGGVGGVSLPKRVPIRQPGWMFIETLTGWTAFKE
jgi:hypothetical protein